MSNKRKRVDLGLNAKMEILQLLDSKCKRPDIANQFGIDVSTISKIASKREKITQDFHSSLSSVSCKRMRKSSYVDIEDALLKWFKQTRSSQLPVSGPILAEVAERLAKEMGQTEWKCSAGFLDRFKKRHNIAFKVAAGEAGSVDKQTVDDWLTCLPQIISDYSPDDIFNMDETGVFYKMLPDRTLCFKDEKCHGGKCAKDRLTAAICTNMSGSEKLPLLVIGKSANPRCFKNVKSLPVDYRANKKAWMTGEMFEEWVVSFDKKIKKKKRKVLLFVDNCPAHVDVQNLTATKLVFLPPNTTSVLQPCDQGIIYAFKQQYRKRIVRHMLHALEQKKSADIDVKIAIDFMHAAWNAVSQATIVNCFRKSHFTSSLPCLPEQQEANEGNEDNDIDDVPLALLTDDEWKAIAGPAGHSLTFDDFVQADDGLVAREVQTIEQIAASCSADVGNAVSDDEPDSESTTDDSAAAQPAKDNSPPSLRQCIAAFETLRAYIDSMQGVAEGTLNALSDIQDFLLNRPVSSYYITVDDHKLLSCRQLIL